MEITDEIKNTDYSHLEGTVIELLYKSGTRILVVVAGLDYYIGMTLKKVSIDIYGVPIKNDDGNYATIKNAACYNGESSPFPDADDPEIGNYDYDKFFVYAIKAIALGTFSQADAEVASEEERSDCGLSGYVNCGYSA